MSESQNPDCCQAAAPSLSETCCPATGKLDWFDMIYPWQNHSLWGYCIPHASATPCLWIEWAKFCLLWSKGQNSPNPGTSPWTDCSRSSGNTITSLLILGLFPLRAAEAEHNQRYQSWVWALNPPGTITVLWTHSPSPKLELPHSLGQLNRDGSSVFYTLKGAARMYKLLKHKLPKIHLKFTLNLAPEM